MPFVEPDADEDRSVELLPIALRNIFNMENTHNLKYLYIYIYSSYVLALK